MLDIGKSEENVQYKEQDERGGGEKIKETQKRRKKWKQRFCI